MNRHPEHDARITELEDGLADVVRRLRALEDGRCAAVPAADDADTAPPGPPDTVSLHARPADSSRGTSDLTSLATLLGRTFIVFGGAYLLRALTESGRLPGTAGILIGLAYSLTWLVAADRAAGTRPLSAQFHGVTAMLVGLPIVWEATARFGLMSPGTAAVLFAVVSILAFVVAGRGQLGAVAAMAGFGTMAAAIATAWSTSHYGVFALLLIALSTATYWLSERSGYAWLRWPNAVAAGLSVIAVTTRALATPPAESMWMALVAQGALLVTMQGSLAVRIVMFGRNVRFFDIIQAASGLLIGVGGAVLLARGSDAGFGLIGAITAILASGAYLAAFFRLADRPHLTESYHAFATFGLVAAIAALVLLFSGSLLALAAVTLSLVSIVLGPRRLAGYGPLHAAAYVLTALTASGVLSASLAVWTMIPSPWPSMDGIGWITLAATGMCATWRTQARREIGDVLAMSGRVITASAFVLVAGGATLVLVGPLIAGTPPDAGVFASLRTAFLSVAVIGLGAGARWPETSIFARLVYPVLIVGGLRFVADDFRHSRPATLFIALALYGLALVLGPRLAARAASARRATRVSGH